MLRVHPSDRRRGISNKGKTVGASILVIVLVVSAVYLLEAGGVGSQGTASRGTSGKVLISLGQAPRILGPGTTMNYTLTVMPGSGATGDANLSTDSPQGLTVNFNPSKITFSGGDTAVDVSVHASDSIAPGDYNVGFRVLWGAGSSNVTLLFRIVQHMVLLTGGYVHAGGFEPQTINIRVGDSVLWMSVDPGGDEFGGQRQVRVVELNATSPTLVLYSSWSYTFARAGNYTIEDPLNNQSVPDGMVLVS